MNPARSIVHAVMRRIEAGAIEVDERFAGGERLSFGPASAPLRARVIVNDPALYAKLVRSKSIAFGESYAAARLGDRRSPGRSCGSSRATSAAPIRSGPGSRRCCSPSSVSAACGC